MKVLLLVPMATVLVCRVSGQFGSDPCTEGPSYWCSSADSADECQTSSYCSTQVWPNGVAPAASDQSTASSTAAKPVGLLSQPQSQLLNMLEVLNVGELEEKLFSSLDSFAMAMPKFDDCDCESCYYIVNLFNSWLQEKNVQDLIINFYKKLCMNTPASMQEHCVDVVSKHFLDIIEDIAYLDPKKACKDECAATASPAQTTPKQLPKLAASDKPVNTCLCQSCQELFQDIASEFGKKNLQDNVVNEFNKLCEFMPNAQVASCKNESSGYIPELFDMMSNLIPARACRRFKFCENHTAPLQPTQEVLKPTTKPKFHVPCVGPYFDLTQRNQDGSIPAEVMEIARISGLVNVPNDDCDCESCKYYYAQFASCLKRNATQKFIDGFFRQICMDTPSDMQQDCAHLVNRHFQVLLADVANLDPDKACKKDCTAAKEVPRAVDKSLTPTNTCLCQRCQAYVQELASLMGQKQYQQILVNEYTDLCKLMKGDAAVQKCTSEAKVYIPEMFDMLSHITPMQTCSHFKYCQKAKPTLL